MSSPESTGIPKPIDLANRRLFGYIHSAFPHISAKIDNGEIGIDKLVDNIFEPDDDAGRDVVINPVMLSGKKDEKLTLGALTANLNRIGDSISIDQLEGKSENLSALKSEGRSVVAVSGIQAFLNCVDVPYLMHNVLNLNDNNPPKFTPLNLASFVYSMVKIPMKYKLGSGEENKNEILSKLKNELSYFDTGINKPREFELSDKEINNLLKFSLRYLATCLAIYQFEEKESDIWKNSLSNTVAQLQFLTNAINSPKVLIG